MAKFQIGHKVKTTFFSGAAIGTVVGVFNTYYVVEFIDRDGNPYTYSYQEHELVECEDFFVHTCECGAKFTAFPDSHAFWCPRFKEVK
jgi:hypothetical protein